MATCVELLWAGLGIAPLADGTFSAGVVEPFYSHSLIEECWGGIGPGLNDSPDAFVADDRVVGAPAEDSADFGVTDKER